MSNIQVKPAPTLDRAAWPLLKHPASGGLLDAVGEVPADGRPWLNDGFTARMLCDGAILRADDPAFAPLAAAEEKVEAEPTQKVEPDHQVPPPDAELEPAH